MDEADLVHDEWIVLVARCLLWSCALRVISWRVGLLDESELWCVILFQGLS